MTQHNHYIMKELPVSEQPYEKCRKYGPQALSDAELLAMVLRSGTKGKTSVQLAQELLKTCEQRGGITGIYHLTLPQLMAINGIGEVKALQIQAIGELSKRISKASGNAGLNFSNPETIAQYYMEDLRHREQECLYCMMLDTKNQLLHEIELFRGTVNASVISPREIFLEALRYHAVYIILIHNHPSGNPSPSKNDILVTERIRRSGELLDIALLDHIIIGNHSYISFRERNMLN